MSAPGPLESEYGFVQWKATNEADPESWLLVENPALRLLVVEDHGDLRGALKAYVGMLG